MTTAAWAEATATAAAVTSPDEVVQHAPDGLAVIDADARFVDAMPPQL